MSVRLVLGPIKEAAVHMETGGVVAGLVAEEEDAAEDTRPSNCHRYLPNLKSDLARVPALH